MRGWGLLLAVAVPLLIFFSSDAAALMRPLHAYFLKQQQPAAAQDLNGCGFQCVQAPRTGYRVAQAGSLGGVFKLAGGKEYWVHNDMRAEQNC
jgi:hypothetical protein